MLKRSLFRASNFAGRAANACSLRLDPRAAARLYSFAPKARPRGRILLAHRTDGMGLPADHPRMTEHNQFPEALAIVDALVRRGYAVDAVSSDRRLPTPRGDYDLFLGLRTNFDMLSARLDPGCVRVLQIDTTHWLFNNQASLGRSLEVQRSRGVTPERDIEIARNRAIETADYAVMAGNDFVYETFAFAGVPVFEIVNPAMLIRPWNDGKDFNAARRRFLWMGSGGLAHKGLGRTLEAFAGLSDHHLTVCGPLDREPRFCEAHHRELRQTPNIRAHGWIDQTGPEFAALADATLAHVFPSCAEAQAGAVINCMAAGPDPDRKPAGRDGRVAGLRGAAEGRLAARRPGRGARTGRASRGGAARHGAAGLGDRADAAFARSLQGGGRRRDRADPAGASEPRRLRLRAARRRARRGRAADIPRGSVLIMAP